MGIERQNYTEQADINTPNELQAIIDTNKTTLAEMLSGETRTNEKMNAQYDTLQALFDKTSFQAQEQITELSNSMKNNEVLRTSSIDITGLEIASRTGNLGKFLEAETRV